MMASMTTVVVFAGMPPEERLDRVLEEALQNREEEAEEEEGEGEGDCREFYLAFVFYVSEKMRSRLPSFDNV